MRIRLQSFVPVFLLVLLYSCGDDRTNEVEPPRDPAVQTIDDDDALREYLGAHFYNYEDFQSQPNASLDIVIDTIAGDNAAKTPLLDQVSTKVVTIEDEDGVRTEHTMYYLVIRQGALARPSVVDSTYVTYKGELLDGTVFDQREFPIWFDLPRLVRGFREGITELRAGSYTVDASGDFTFSNFGQGLLFFPSPLGYFDQGAADIPTYSPLVFHTRLYTINVTDHDLDGINSIDEDVDGDGDPLNDDTDEDGLANMYDLDDDNDGVYTNDEYDEDGDGTPDDTDGDGIPDYLDPEDN
ncbi:MAG: FKBP-type peptidyl-prolyl cis-trans isomerase [Flavobacteriaceae bacterium]